MHLMRCLHRVPSEAMMSLMSSILGMNGHAPKAEGHRACGGSRALPYQEVGLEPQDMWHYRSPVGQWSWCLGHVVTPEPSCVGDEHVAVRYVVTLEPSPVG
jgi:hypothetical protein